MRIYLVRHGEAEISDVDPQRSLTDKGRAEVQKTANLLRTLNLNVKSIWHSHERRAQQSAEILNEAVTSSRGVVQKKGLGPRDAPEPVKKVLEKYRDDLMIVGHLPLLDQLAGLLLISGSDEAEAETGSQPQKPGGLWGGLADLAEQFHRFCLKKSGAVQSQPRPEVISFRHGAVLCLERRHGGVWKVAWMLLPDAPQITREEIDSAPEADQQPEETEGQEKGPTFEPPLPPGAEQTERGPIPPGGSVYHR